jgi:hypothetical protein
MVLRANELHLGPNHCIASSYMTKLQGKKQTWNITNFEKNCYQNRAIMYEDLWLLGQRTNVMTTIML